MSMEAALVIGLHDEILYEHLPPGRNSAALPDSRDLWEVIWENRARLQGIAHSHPGRGECFPSKTDATTFDAVEAGLGKSLTWWICTREACREMCHSPRVSRRTGEESLCWRSGKSVAPSWLPRLRELSYGSEVDQALWLLAEQARRVLVTPPVDDDFPEILRSLDRALKDPWRLDMATASDPRYLKLRAAVVQWRSNGYGHPAHISASREVASLLTELGFLVSSPA